MVRKTILKIAMVIALAITITLLYLYDPTTSAYSYHCPIKALTGFDCPGCGGQRAAHALLHLRFNEAVAYNPFLVVAALYLFAVVALQFLKGPRVEKARRFVFSQTMVWIYLALMIAWTIVRNIIS